MAQTRRSAVRPARPVRHPSVASKGWPHHHDTARIATRPPGHHRVDIHKDLHVAAARDQLGRRLATIQIPTTSAGYAQLLAWADG